ncbi:hypothetical protein [Parasitella parasitica]|uniref:ATPase inhibitor, mitochondrial n=1 Tax=Parasitella parasitica TaxID=35722 RepID=A0A0B7NX24_9FUNG|nr:hypothetical protein [Parasitella parasitica]
MFNQISTRFASTCGRCSNMLSRRTLHMTSILRSEGATASSKGFKEKETAVENQWARSHDAELLKSLKKTLAEQEQATADIKQKLSELESKQTK